MSDYFDRVEQRLVRAVEAPSPSPRRWPGRLVAVAAALVAVAVVGVFLGVRGRGQSTGLASGSRVVFSASAPTAQLDRAANILRLRLEAVFHDVHVIRAGDAITVSAAGASAAQIEALGAPGRLAVYDWEANVLTPNGTTLAGELAAQSPDAFRIGGEPGSAGAGAMALYDAVRLASRQAPGNGRNGWQYYMFGVPGGAGCRLVHRPGHGHCLLGGPAPTAQQLVTTLPAGVITAMGVQFAVPRGIVVLQAAASRFGRGPAMADPAARFYVLRDHAAMAGSFLTDPHAGRDASGQPDVEFGFTPAGARAFRRVTAAVARRGAAFSGAGLTLDQHFAIVLDRRIVTVPSIDYKSYPEGIPSSDGADIDAGFTPQSARQLAALLRFGPLPVELRAR